MIEFDARLQSFRVALSGRVDASIVFKNLEEMFAHPDFYPGAPAIWLADAADLRQLDAEAFRKFRDYQLNHASVRGSARIALVSANDLSFALGRMFEQSTALANLSIRVFRDVVSAEAWILEGLQRKGPADRSIE